MSAGSATTPGPRPVALAVRPEALPAEITERPLFAGWRYEWREGRWAKAPQDARTGGHASATDSATWAPLPLVLQRLQPERWDGIMMALTPPYTGIDLDGCRDAESGEITDWAQPIVARLDSYTEVSPSGRGLHIFVRGALPAAGRRRRGAIEMYDQARFFTMTGRRVPGTPGTIQERQQDLDELYRATFGVPEAVAVATPVPAAPPDADAALVQRAMNAANGAKFAALWAGETQGYPSASDADAALCALLAFWAGPDPARIDRLFRQSGLYRVKWERADYRARTIALALAQGTLWMPARHDGGALRGGAGGEPLPRTLPPRPELADEALYGLPGALVAAIDPHTEAHPTAVLLNVLLYFGSAVGPTPHALVGSKRHTLNTNAVYVGETSKGRKGTSMAEVDALFGRVDPAWHDARILSGLASGEGLIYNVRDAAGKKDKDGRPLDEGVRDKRLLVVEEEFAAVLKAAAREGNTLSPIIRQAWDSGTLRTLTRNSPLCATGAHIGIIGHITQGELRRYLTETESGNGFANRFLWVWTHRSKLLPDGGGIPTYGPLVPQLHDALAFGRTLTAPLARDPDARELWHAVYGDLSEGRPGLVGAVTGRAEAHVLRLSLLYAVMDRSPRVGVRHLQAALALWDYCAASAAAIFGDAQGDPVADRILTALRAAGAAGLSMTDINDLFKGKTPGSRLHAALQDLERSGAITRQRTEETGGRARTVYSAA